MSQEAASPQSANRGDLPEINNPQGFTGPMLHMGIAEQGKIHAVEGDHATALLYYRRAMHMTVEAKDEEWFFRHYLECSIESLELTESYDEVLAYCDKAIELYEGHPPEDPISIRDLAHIHQRKGIVLVKKGDREAAKEPLREAVRLAHDADQTIPLAERVLRWVESGLGIDNRRLLAEQKREKYFTVRSDNIDRERAVKLPDELLAIRPF